MTHIRSSSDASASGL